MSIRFRIGPFTFGKSGTRISTWKGGTGVSIPITKRKKNKSFGKVKLGPLSFFFGGGKKKKRDSNANSSKRTEEISNNFKQAYQPWTKEADEKLILLFREGKTVGELSEIFGRSTGAIRSRINKLLMQ